jgi:predicted TIM-barrel fold metal-dependent hydrolase
MPLPSKLPIIDADAHVIETERTWDYLEPSEQKFRPLLYACPDQPGQQYWVVDGKIRGFRFRTLSEQQLQDFSDVSGRNMQTPQAARELDDVDLRLKHMDSLDIDVQVMHNTFWIEQVSERPEIETALCRSWNRWMGEIWRKSNNRLRWSCVTPVLAMNEAIAEVKTAKENGAVAVCLRPLEGNRHLTDPYYYPLYETASNLDLPIAVHIANGNPANCDLYRNPPVSRFATFRQPTVTSCLDVLLSEIPSVFPKLRWGYIETSAQWVPWIYNEVMLRTKTSGRKLPEDVFGEYNIFVTCQTNDDVPYILRYSGKHCLLIGTDYGHTDPSSEMDAIIEFQRQEGVSPEDKERILSLNPSKLYGLATTNGQN